MVVTNEIDDGIPELTVVSGAKERILHPGWLLSQPSFSPDGTKVVAVRATKGDYESAGPSEEQLWVLDADGTDAFALTEGLRAAAPDWSPDSRWVVYVEETTGGEHFLSVIAADGKGDPARLFPVDDSVATPTWSPDGKLIALIRDGELVTVQPDGSGLAVVAPVPEYSEVGWHPDEDALVVTSFEQTDHPSGPRIFTSYDVTTGEAQQLGVGDSPKWTPDGKRLYLIDPEGLGAVRGGAASGDLHEPDALPVVYQPDPDRVRLGLGSFDVTGC